MSHRLEMMTTTETISSPDPHVAFLLDLARVLHSSGMPSHELEDAMSSCAERLDMEAQFFATPTAIFVSLGSPTAQRTTLMRVEPGAVDLERLSRAEALYLRLADGRYSVEDAQRELRDIEAAPRIFSRFWAILALSTTSGAAARFFGGGVAEILTAFVIGVALGGLDWLAVFSPRLKRVFDPAAALLASLIAGLSASLFGTGGEEISVLAGLIVLLPGLSVTLAMSELAERQLASGTARLMGALTVFLTLAFGVALGRGIAASFPILQPAVPIEPLTDPYSLWIALILAPLTFVVLFHAPLRDAFWVICGGLVAFWGARLGGEILRPEIGASVGALLLGLVSNSYARVSERPSAVLLVPGLILLVPGSLGFRSLTALLRDDVLSGVETAFAMALVAASIVAGLLVANVALPPRKMLKR